MNIYLHNKLQQVDQDAEVKTSIKLILLDRPEHIITWEHVVVDVFVDITLDPSW